MKLFSGRKTLILSSPGFVFFWTERFTCLAFLTPEQLGVVQLSLLTRITFVISFGIPARPPKVQLGRKALMYNDSQAAAKIDDVGIMKLEIYTPIKISD